MQKIGLLGGTFDPIHNGHVELALKMAERLGLEKVLFMPTFVPVHKIRTQMATAEDRLAMCRLAAEPYPNLDCSDLELTRGGASFSVDTMTELHRLYPDSEWYLIVGADMFLTLSTWYRFDRLAQLTAFCTIPREPYTRDALLTYAASLESRGARCFVEPFTVQTVSSTQIREAIARHESVQDQLPPAVYEYIRRHQIYLLQEGLNSMDRDQQFIEIIQKRLTPRRFEHSLAVSWEAERLAKKYGADPVKAKTAGILHDILKDTDGEVLLQMCTEFGIIMDDVEKNAPKLWHARIGAAFVEKILELNDDEIVRAIRYHTTARAGMTMLEKVLYLADYTSADRDYEDVDVMRRLVDVGIDEAMEYALSYSITELVEKRVAVHPDTVEAYNECMLRRVTQA